MHGGEFSEEIVNYVYFNYGCQGSDVYKKSRLLAHAIRNKHLIYLSNDAVHDTTQATYSDEVALRLVIGVASNECGDMGMVDPRETGDVQKGLTDVMRPAGMLEGEVSHK